MKTLGNLLLITSGVVLFAAIWTPDAWLQLLLTGLLLFLAAAAVLGRNHVPQPDERGPRELAGGPPPPPPAKRPGNTIRRTRN